MRTTPVFTSDEVAAELKPERYQFIHSGPPNFEGIAQRIGNDDADCFEKLEKHLPKESLRLQKEFSECSARIQAARVLLRKHRENINECVSLAEFASRQAADVARAESAFTTAKEQLTNAATLQPNDWVAAQHAVEFSPAKIGALKAQVEVTRNKIKELCKTADLDFKAFA